MSDVLVTLQGVHRHPSRTGPSGLGSWAFSSLTALLDNIAPSVGERVAILAPDVCARLAIGGTAAAPAWPEPEPGTGWTPGAPAGPWRTYRSERRAVHLMAWPIAVGQDAGVATARRYAILAGALDTAELGAGCPNILQRLTAWRCLTGWEYRGTPGVAAATILRAVSGKGMATPRWHSTAGPVAGYEPEEARWAHVPPSGALPAHTYDANSAYLASGISALFSRNALEHTGRVSFVTPDTWKVAGWWLTEPAPWQRTRMPAPWGSSAGNDPGPIWVTTPTLRLMHDMTEAGALSGFTIRDSWTGPGSRVLRPWGELIRDSLLGAARWPDQLQRRPLVQTLKAGYRETVGLMNREGGTVYRPDWHYTIVAQARTTLWRNAWNIGENTGRWPLTFATDALQYAAVTDDPIADNPGLTLGPGLGQWKVKAS